MKWLIGIAVCYAMIGCLTVAVAGYREGFQQLYRSDMLKPADMFGIFAFWPVVWIGFTAVSAYTGALTVLDKAVRQPAQKIGEAHKQEWETRKSAIREVDRLLRGEK